VPNQNTTFSLLWANPLPNPRHEFSQSDDILLTTPSCPQPSIATVRGPEIERPQKISAHDPSRILAAQL
jgi:hypothetical protein